jgi:methyl-accepting chemotaxis protein
MTMQAQKAKLRFNSIFFKFGLMIVFCMVLLLAINTQIQARFVKHLTMDFVGREAQSFGLLSADVIAGSVRFGKSEQMETMFRSNIEHAQGQILGMVAVAADGSILTEVADTPFDRSEVLEMSRKAIARQEVVTSGDGLIVATPVRFGKDLDVIGAVVGLWSPATFLAEFAKDSVTAIAVSSVATLVIALGALLFFGRSLVTPMNRCREAILSLAQSRFDVTIPGIARGDEMGEMARALQVLRDVLAAGEELQKEPPAQVDRQEADRPSRGRSARCPGPGNGAEGQRRSL